LFAQVQAEAATTWRFPATSTSDVVRGTDRLRTWSEGSRCTQGHDRRSRWCPRQRAARARRADRSDDVPRCDLL